MRHYIAIQALLLFIANTQAHDLWLIPPESGKPKEKAVIKAVSGNKFPKGESAPDPSLFVSRLGRDAEMKKIELTADGKDDSSGLLGFMPDKAGVYAFGVQTKPKILAMTARKFNDYLVSDGLPHIYKLRAKEDTLGEDAKEQYSKSPKVLLCIGDESAGDPCSPLGLTLEIVPMENLFKKKPGEALKVKVLFNGKPLPAAHLGWDHPGETDEPAGTVVADAEGVGLIPLAKAGLMTIRLTHMTRPKSADYEWESFWTTMTFHLPGGK